MFFKYAQFYDLFNSDKPYKKEIEFVYRWAGKPKLIFDIGCGTGSYWKYFPKDARIIGLEKSQDMADKGERIICADATTFQTPARFECATALFDVINYIPTHDWWKNIPVQSGGYFVFDIWDSKKIRKEGFQETTKKIGDVFRRITPLGWDKKSVELRIEVWQGKEYFKEIHRMYIYAHADIKKFCGKEFDIVEVKPTARWQTWYLCKRK